MRFDRLAVFFLPACLFALSACQTTAGPDTHQWRQVANGPDFETADAYCRMQGIAITPPDLAIYGGSLANQVQVASHNSAMRAREGEFVMLCLRSQGWALVPIEAHSQPTN